MRGRCPNFVRVLRQARRFFAFSEQRSARLDEAVQQDGDMLAKGEEPFGGQGPGRRV